MPAASYPRLPADPTVKKLHKLIITTYIGPFFATFFITLFILVMQFLWKYIDDLVGKGLEWYVIAELLFYASANLVPMALPLAILLSSIMTFGNLGEHYELVALKSSGLSLQRIMRPLIIITFLLAGVAFYFSNNVWPVANLKFATLLYDVRQKKPAIDIREGVFYKGLDDFVIRAGSKNMDTQELGDVVIYDHTERRGNTKVIRAEKGRMQMSEDEMYLVLTLENGTSYEEVLEERKPNTKPSNKFPLFRSTFDKEIIRFDLSGFKLGKSDEDLFKDNTQMLNLSQLNKQTDTLWMKFNARDEEFHEQLQKKLMYARDSMELNPSNTAWVSTMRARPPNIDSASASTAATTNNRQPPKPGQNPNQQAANRYFKGDTVMQVTAAAVNAQWSFLDDMTPGDRAKAIEGAINLTRSSNTYINSMRSEFKSRMKTIKRHGVEWHRKFTLSFACIVLFFVGAPLGSIIRKGGLGMPVVVSVILFIVFHVLNMTGEKMAKHGDLEPVQGMWMASAVLTPLGIYLTWKATTDSPLMDAETYSRPIRWISTKLGAIGKLFGRNNSATA